MKLKEPHVRDRALLVVVADHGVSFRLQGATIAGHVRANARDIAPVPLFVKYPGQRGGGSISLFYDDVMPTIAPTIGAATRVRLTGRSRAVAVLAAPPEAHVTVHRDAPDQRIRIGAGAFLGA